jgi:isopentenyl diphosphate isomerase/L-lactate dehydrogenase-like FMN-dependent dehydrogenase
VIRTVMAEFDLTMALTGATSVDQLGPDRLRRAE